MKDQILKIAKVKSEKEFYKKYPSEEAFMKAHGKAFKKAAMGSKMVNDQLHQLTDFGNPPIAQVGGNFSKYLQGTNQFGMNPDGTMRQVGGAFNNASMAQYSGQQAASQASAQYATPSGDQLLGKNAINSGEDAGGGGKGAAAATAVIGALPGIIGGVQAIGAQRKAINKAYQARELSELNLQANSTREKVKRKYVRPEDYIAQPGQLGNPYGSGTNFLSKNGRMIGGNPTEIQNMYNPGDIYTDAGYEPLESQKLKQYKQGGNLPEAEFGEYFQDSGQAQIGSSVGTAAGTLIGGPLGGAIGGLLGKGIGNLLGGARDARELQAQKDKAEMNTQQAAYQQTMQNQFGAYMKDGGWVSNDWQPQTFTKFGEYSAKDLLKPPHDADMLRAGGHLKEYTPPSAEAMFTGRPELKPLTMEHGGQMAMGGDLEILEGGKAETISYNPYLPDGGETVMFKGRSHDNGGIPINFGENGVEVEGGEPAVKLKDGGNSSNMVVFGNMKLSKMAADEFGIPDAKGKKFKHVANDISKVEKKQNKLIDQATETANMTTGSSGFDQLKLNTSQAQLMGANMKLKSAAMLKQNLAAVQNAILDTASELGVKSDKLAEGKLEKETDPSMMAQNGTLLDKIKGLSDEELMDPAYPERMQALQEYSSLNNADREMMRRGMGKPGFMGIGATDLDPVTVTGNRSKSQRLPTGIEPFIKGLPLYEPLAPQLFTGEMPNIEMAFKQPQAQAQAVGEGEGEGGGGGGKFGDILKKYGPTILSNLAPFLRPRTRLPLDPEQLYPEYLSMATNQLEPVQAQTFQPMLDTPIDISLNDQLNTIDSQSRAAIRAAGQNPSAQSMIMAQSLEAKNKVLGEQTRINALNKMQTYNKNREIINDAKLRNLQILDQQYVRQAQAKSNTKAQALEAVKSIAAKTAQNKLENQTLNVYENMYNYRFSPSGRAFNVNAPAQFNVPENIGVNDLTGAQIDKIKELYEKVVSRDKAGAITGSKEKTRTTKQNRNGAIVQALKNL